MAWDFLYMASISPKALICGAPYDRKLGFRTGLQREAA